MTLSKAATEPAIDLLTEKFREVEREILAVFTEHKEHNDPIEAAVNHSWSRMNRDWSARTARRNKEF
jgi:hypothetical protein